LFRMTIGTTTAPDTMSAIANGNTSGTVLFGVESFPELCPTKVNCLRAGSWSTSIKGFWKKAVADYARSLQKNLPKLNLLKRKYAGAKVKALVQ
jgi:hypothetical protein